MLEKISNGILFNCDCVTAMERLFNIGFRADLTLTSPPYDNMRNYTGEKQWCEGVWKNVIWWLYQITKRGGTVVWVVGDATVKGSETGTSFKQALWALDCGFNLHDTMIWEKTGNGALGSRLCYGQNFEYMFVFSKGRPKTVNLIEDRPNTVKSGLVKVNSGVNADKNSKARIIYRKPFGKRNNIWKIDPQKNSDHPAPFPESLALGHVISWSNRGDIVFDPFMGSGTTAKVAEKTGRAWVGSEISKEYCEIIKKRLYNDK